MSDVVVGVDRSDSARRAAHAAARLASAYGANLHMVTCAKPEASQSGGVGSDQFTTNWEHDAEEFLKALAREVPHDAVTCSVLTDDPASAIVAEASRVGAGTIVVGNARAQGVSRVLGSVASAVIRKAPCDVLVAHTT